MPSHFLLLRRCQSTPLYGGAFPRRPPGRTGYMHRNNHAVNLSGDLAMAELEAGTTAGTRRMRPLSPHLQVYKPMLTMMMSIVHRITGAGLYFGMLLLAWWLTAAATGPNAYANVEWFMGSLI